MNHAKLATLFIVSLACVLMVPFFVQAQAKKNSPSIPAQIKIVDINKANVEELANVPGVGLKIAERILEYRNKNGKFKSKEEIMNVKGIGEKKYERIKNLISVEKTP
jgi:comEA protein